MVEPSLELVQRQNLELREELLQFKSGGGGGGDGVVMEQRVARLEENIVHIRSDVGEIKGSLGTVNSQVTEARINIATLIERVAHLPTKGFIVNAVLTALAVAAALVLFQGNIQKFFHIS
jgi:hypothetical protein